MNREIRYNAWHPNEKVYIKNYAVQLSSGEIRTIQYHSSSILYCFENVIPLEYIGVKDVDNKHVFEGDIVNKSGAYIVWSNTLHCWCFKFEGQSDETPLFYDKKTKLKVIGNIYQHPSLLTPKSSTKKNNKQQ